MAELGEWWLAETGLPLPLGVNVIRRALGSHTIAEVSAALRASIRYALAHRAQILPLIMAERRGEVALDESALLDRYLAMYANQDTLGMAPDVRIGLATLLARAEAAGLLPACMVEWAP